jgi:hypothetical protein
MPATNPKMIKRVKILYALDSKNIQTSIETYTTR